MKYVSFFLLTIISATVIFASDTNSESNFGNAIIHNIHDVNTSKTFQFKCDIKNYPPIVGKNMNIIIDDIEPNIVEPNDVLPFLENTFRNAKIIQLKNLKRGESFCIVADVYCNKKNLSETLIKKGYAVKSKISTSLPKKLNTEFEKAGSKKLRYVGSKTSKVFHKNTCKWAKSIAKKNKASYKSREEAIDKGKRPCKTCKP